MGGRELRDGAEPVERGLQDKLKQKAEKDAVDAKYKFALVDGRTEQV